MYARYNGLFPTQDKIVAKIKKAWKNLGDRGYVRLKIPWSDFEFSSVEPWPKSYREGLVSYKLYYQSLLDNEPEIPEDDEPRYAVLGVSRKKFILSSPRQKDKIFSQLMDRPLLSTRELITYMRLDDLSVKSDLGHGILYADLLLWDQKQQAIIEWSDVESARAYFPRMADLTGVFLELQKYGRKEELRELNVDGDLHYQGGFTLRSKKQDIETLVHEVMHFAQKVGDNLLVARKTPEIAFFPHFSSIKDVSGLGPKPSLTRQSTLDLWKSTYEEDVAEFYPQALSSGAGALAYNAQIPLMNRVISAGFWIGFSIIDARQRFLFFRAAYRYAKQLSGLSTVLSQEEKEALKRYTNAVSLEEMADLFAQYLVYQDKSAFYRVAYLSRVLNTVFRRNQSSAVFDIYDREIVSSTGALDVYLYGQACELASLIGDKFNGYTGRTLDLGPLLHELKSYLAT
jgi:hypothetical protein